MITQEYQPNEVSSTVKPGVKHPSVGVMRGVVIINRSPWWMEAKLGPQRLFIIPAWHEAGFTVPEQSNDFTLSVYSEASGPILDFDVPTIPHGIWVDGEAYVEKAYLTPLVVGNVPLLGSGEGTGSQPVVLTGSLAPKPYLYLLQSPGVSVPAGAAYQTPGYDWGGYRGLWMLNAEWSTATTGQTSLNVGFATGWQGALISTTGTASIQFVNIAWTAASPLVNVVFPSINYVSFSNSGSVADTLTKWEAYIQ